MIEPSPAQLPVDDGGCYVCGPLNGDGLGIRFQPEGRDAAGATVTLAQHLQGYRGIAHGGIVMLLLDEVMAQACGAAGDMVVTAAAAVRFRAPVPLGVPLSVRAQVRSKRGKILRVEGTIHSAAGALLASAQGSFASLGPLEAQRFGNSGAREPV